jgi:hypothetical protein
VRTTSELLAKIKELSTPEGAVRAALVVQLLPYRHARRFLKAERKIDKAGWEDVRIHPTDERVLFVMAARQPEAWGAANAKSTKHISLCFHQFEMLLWFLGLDHEEAYRRMWDRFEHYGKPQLVWLCEEYGLGEWRQWDDGRWQMTILNAALPAEEALASWRRRGLRSVSPSPDQSPPTTPGGPSTPS